MFRVCLQWSLDVPIIKCEEDIGWRLDHGSLSICIQMTWKMQCLVYKNIRNKFTMIHTQEENGFQLIKERNTWDQNAKCSCVPNHSTRHFSCNKGLLIKVCLKFRLYNTTNNLGTKRHCFAPRIHHSQKYRFPNIYCWWY